MMLLNFEKHFLMHLDIIFYLCFLAFQQLDYMTIDLVESAHLRA